ncbi:MAG: VanZ family protein [Bacteroidales bacterium]|nr:VanZ family protein [Bacteroidales bacterium]MDD2424492.1 VanZ family protein [Bacteroidales bacterium]MDD3988526.1 VanZ family protein [Bacteroidales bacterium]MDD4638213.1 VanZ family protein [Bacteroidales bacterium]
MKRQILFRWILFFAYVSAIFTLMIVKINPSEVEIPRYILGIEFDKLAHFFLFLPYAPLAWLAFSPGKLSSGVKLRLLIPIFFSGVTLGALTEVAQMMTPFRNADIVDLSTDILSLATGTLTLFLWLIIYGRIKRKRRSV